MRKLVLAFGILVSVVSVGMGAMSSDEWNRAVHNCFENDDKNACYALINDGLPSVQQCEKHYCGSIGGIYYFAERYREAIPYFEKAIALGDREYASLGNAYYKLQDYYNAKKYYEIGCNKGNTTCCYNLGGMYWDGKGVRQDYYKATELYKKACDMKYGDACNNLGVLYNNGQGVRQNRSIAKQYFGKACDLGFQIGCDNYRRYNSAGVR